VAPEHAGDMTSLQGVLMGRPSLLHMAIDSEGGTITGVRVGGSAVVVGQGTLSLDS
jgi:trans-2,3-dihydro-3-hydroxyanthranilate isomerase